LFIDVTVANVITPNVKGKKGTGSKAQSREVTRATKNKALCRVLGMSSLPVNFESQELAEQQFLEHFE